MSMGWSIFISVFTLANIVACVWLLWWTSRQNPGVKASETTHVWDEDLTELNNPLPSWWLILFYLTVLFSLGYLVLYPGLGNFSGTLNWSQDSQYQAESARIEARKQEIFAKFDGKGIPVLAADPEAREVGSRIYANNCAVCHGADGRGARGFPNLADDDWLYGGEPHQVVTSIAKGRRGMMPPLAGVLGERGVAEVAVYVYQLNDREPEPVMRSMIDSGRQRFASTCAVCHGADGTGNIALGAPDLTDDAWIFGSSFEAIKESIANGRSGNMPAHERLLSHAEIRLVAGYVYSLSNMEKK